MGNSAGVILPKGVLDDLQIGIGQQLDLRVEGGKLVASPVKGGARRGWAEAALELRTQEDDLPVWPDLANDEDDALQW
jgi:antitoxin component of MazEF toxin-antitoxin module